MAKRKIARVVDNCVELQIETHDVLTKEAEAYLTGLAKDPTKREAFIKSTGIIGADRKLTKVYKGRGTRSHAY
ncbi:MAG: hypothetical protein WAT84_03240 [Candidatus Moraniibacteriota bacterium]